MKRIKSQKEWLQSMKRSDLNAYIKKCAKLVEEAEKEGNQHNLSIYSLWLNQAITEARRRDKVKEFWLEHIIKKDSRF